jgi:hypothetical protein
LLYSEEPTDTVVSFDDGDAKALPMTGEMAFPLKSRYICKHKEQVVHTIYDCVKDTFIDVKHLNLVKHGRHQGPLV